MKNPVKAKLKAGEPSVGTWLTIGHSDISEFLAAVGFAWIVFETEHAPLGMETVQTMMQAMSHSADCLPMGRVA